MKKIAIVLAAFVGVLSVNALAHGDAKPMHGGIVQVASDIQYELVPQPGGAALYIVDHGQPADAARMSGKLTVLNGTQKSEAELKPAGGNKLEAAQVKVTAGSKVVASVKGADGKSATVRFAVK
jgi:hypothetical protein